MIDNLFKVAQSLTDSLLWAPSQLGLIDQEKLKASTHYAPQAVLDEVLEPQHTQFAIASLIDGPEPFLVTRFGSTELRMVLRYHARRNRSVGEKLYGLLTRFESPAWVRWEHTPVQRKSGFYPVTKEATNRFSELMLGSMSRVDILGSWVPGENQLRPYFPRATITSLSSLSPFGFDEPWTQTLEGKKVLVIHPFTHSIRQQYEKRELLFSNSLLLPEFKLLTIQAVQSLGTPPSEFPTWFDGLAFMHEQTRNIDFDVALIGCGAYGFPLGAKLKDDGKKAVVLGGLVQLLFGIKGKRWDDSGMYNEHWVRPRDAERPDGYLGADQGAYW